MMTQLRSIRHSIWGKHLLRDENGKKYHGMWVVLAGYVHYFKDIRQGATLSFVYDYIVRRAAGWGQDEVVMRLVGVRGKRKPDSVGRRMRVLLLCK